MFGGACNGGGNDDEGADPNGLFRMERDPDGWPTVADGEAV
jgi:hypothetical protein